MRLRSLKLARLLVPIVIVQMAGNLSLVSRLLATLPDRGPTTQPTQLAFWFQYQQQEPMMIDLVAQLEEEPIETTFLVVASLPRSSSTFLTHQVLAGHPHNRTDSILHHHPSVSTCPLHHFVTLNEIFTNDPQQSGDAWDVEGADLLAQVADPKDLNVTQLSGFLQQVAQRRCRERIEEDIFLFQTTVGRSVLWQRDLATFGCPAPRASTLDRGLRSSPRRHYHHHHQCLVSYKHFDFHLSPMQHVELWKTLVPHLRMVVLERSLKKRWVSFWIAVHTGDWNVHGDVGHKEKVTELVDRIPPVEEAFRTTHVEWFHLVREALGPNGPLHGVPRMEVHYPDVISSPVQVREQLLKLAWDINWRVNNTTPTTVAVR